MLNASVIYQIHWISLTFRKNSIYIPDKYLQKFIKYSLLMTAHQSYTVCCLGWLGPRWRPYDFQAIVSLIVINTRFSKSDRWVWFIFKHIVCCIYSNLNGDQQILNIQLITPCQQSDAGNVFSGMSAVCLFTDNEGSCTEPCPAL